MAKTQELHFQLLPQSPDLAPGDFYLFVDLLKKMLAGKRSNAEAYFAAKGKFSVRKLEYCMAFERDYDNEVEFCQKRVSLISPMKPMF